MSETQVDVTSNDTKQERNLLTDSTYVIWYGVNHLSSIVVPVGITMLLSTILVNVVRPSEMTDALEEGMTVYMVYKEEADNTWDAIWQAIVNSFAIVIVIGLMTFGMVLLYKYNLVKVLYGLLFFSTFSAIGYTGWFVFYMALLQYQIPWDVISSIIIFFNLGVVSVICIFGTYAPDWMKKTFLVFISCLVCYLLSFFPDWTTWVLLVAMALYDLCAVLTPCGPLRLLLNLSADREDDIPGLLYEATLDRSDISSLLPLEEERNKSNVEKETSESQAAIPAQKEDHEQEHGQEHEQEQEKKEEDEIQPIQTMEKEEKEKEEKEELKEEKEKSNETTNIITECDYLQTDEEEDGEENEQTEANRIFQRESVQLGLGDFIFYSLMVSKASLSSTVPFVFVFILILAGLLITMALLSVLEMPLPALPFSMILGVLTFALVSSLVSKMVNDFVLSGTMF